MVSTTDFFMRLAACVLVAMTFVNCTPVPPPPPRWHDPCNGQAAPSDPSALPELTRTLNTDAKDINKAANDLQTFTLARLPEDFDKMVANTHFENFTHDFEADKSGTMTTDLLLGDYKHLSRAIIYYEKMIENEGNCSTDATGLEPMKKVMERMYTMLCHVDQVLGIKGQEVTSYENETVLDKRIVGIPESCSSNDFSRQVADYIVSRDTVHYSTELILQYFEIQKALPTAESTSNNSN